MKNCCLNKNRFRFAILICLCCCCCIYICIQNGIPSSSSETETSSVNGDENGLKNTKRMKSWEMAKGYMVSMGGVARRLLGGLGSSPPRCKSKCGQCTPCKPVHVPVPPGTPVLAEYYPEAWRCKCGNKLYMP